MGGLYCIAKLFKGTKICLYKAINCNGQRDCHRSWWWKLRPRIIFSVSMRRRRPRPALFSLIRSQHLRTWQGKVLTCNSPHLLLLAWHRVKATSNLIGMTQSQCYIYSYWHDTKSRIHLLLLAWHKFKATSTVVAMGSHNASRIYRVTMGACNKVLLTSIWELCHF